MLPTINSKSDGNSKSFIKESIKDNNIQTSSKQDDLDYYLGKIGNHAPTYNTSNVKAVKKENSLKRLVPQVTKPNIDEDNMFGLSASEKTIVRTSMVKTPKGEKTMDEIIKMSSGNAINSLESLIFEGRSFLGKDTLKLFKRNISKYSEELLGIITKIVKHVWDLIQRKAQEFAGNLADKWQSVKDSVVKGLNNLLKLEDKTSVNKASDIPGTGNSIIDSVKSLFLIMGGDEEFRKKIKKDSLVANVKGTKQSLSEAISGATKSVVSPSLEDNYINNDSTPIPISESLKTTAGIRLGIYSALRRAGFSDKQSRILTAEIGREGSFNPNNVFGVHGDPKNAVQNIGMISWQKKRNPQLVAWMKSAGLFVNGRMARTQAALDMQAKFIMWEIRNVKTYAITKKLFLDNPNVDYNVGTKVLGTNYIAWRYTDKKYASGHRNRDAAYAAINKQLSHGTGDADFTALEQKSNRDINAAKKPKVEHIAKAPIQLKSSKIYVSAKYDISNQINTDIDNSMPDVQVQYPRADSTPQMNAKSAINNNAPIQSSAESKPMPSFFEMMIQKDLTGNMF